MSVQTAWDIPPFAIGSNMMRFSVVIPCHNAGRWIEECLRSVATQDHRAHQIILIDDDSTDDSLARARASGVAFDLLRTKAHNAAAARNAGIEAAGGEWVALLDADDVWYPNHLRRAAALLEGSGDVAFMSRHDWIDQAGRVIPVAAGFHWPFEHPRPGLPHAAFMTAMGWLHFGHSTVVYRADRLREVGAFDVSQKRRHDIDLWLRMIHSRTWAYDSVASAGYREGTPGSISENLASCEFFYLRCLLRNQAAYEGPEMDTLIRTAARRGMGLAFVDDPRELGPMTELAWPYLTPRYRRLFRLASLCPWLTRPMIRLKRRLPRLRQHAE